MSLFSKAAACALLALPSAAQAFVKNLTDIPQDAKDTEQIDFADVDLDGDWDAALANGGDSGPQQNQLWINQGNLQAGPVGFFSDETLLRLPFGPDPSRDVEFADIDSDADPDLYISEHSATINTGDRWWVNKGGVQGGVLGFYEDQTPLRWIGLGGPGSSIDPAMVLPNGSFIDWSSDGDFADLDNDGDLDLVHSSYGPAYAGTVPTRIFLNDGTGHFTEFNPAGITLTGEAIPNGTPALWCEGVQQHNTLDTTGLEADIADAVVDFKLGDTDGDFDVDIVLTGRSAPRPRFFRNRLELGTLAFRDESALAFPGIPLGFNTFDQELGDLDGDDDLDLYGLNWATIGFSFFDGTLTNTGGVFSFGTFVLGSESADEEVDLLDYDNDGDLDAYVAGFVFSAQDKLFQNQGGSPASFLDVTATELPAGLTSKSRDVEIADVDGDGDYDALIANGAGSAQNEFIENVTQVPDNTAPRIPALEVLPSGVAVAGVVPVRARVFDNVPDYLLWYDDVVFETQVDGIALPALPLAASRGAIFRGELPANLVGLVTYRVRATDEYGNSGVSSTITYTSTGETGIYYGSESAATGAVPPTLRTLSEMRPGSSLYLAGKGIPGHPGFLGVSLASVPSIPVPSLPNLILTIHPGIPLLFTTTGLIGFTGDLVFPLEVPVGASPGVIVFAQFLDLASDGTFGSSKGLALTIN